MALSAPCPTSLEELRDKALAAGFDVVSFHEPDLDDQLTALAFSPAAANKAFLSNLPLAGKKAGGAR